MLEQQFYHRIAGAIYWYISKAYLKEVAWSNDPTRSTEITRIKIPERWFGNNIGCCSQSNLAPLIVVVWSLRERWLPLEDQLWWLPPLTAVRAVAQTANGAEEISESKPSTTWCNRSHFRPRPPPFSIKIRVNSPRLYSMGSHFTTAETRTT